MVCLPSRQRGSSSLVGLCCGPHVDTGSNSLSQDKTTAILETVGKAFAPNKKNVMLDLLDPLEVFHWWLGRNSREKIVRRRLPIPLFSVLKVFWIAGQATLLAAICYTQRCR